MFGSSRNLLVLIGILSLILSVIGADQSHGIETINQLNADGSFHFKSTQNGNLVEINGSLMDVDGRNILVMEGVYKFEGFEVAFTADETGYSTKHIGESKLQQSRPGRLNRS